MLTLALPLAGVHLGLLAVFDLSSRLLPSLVLLALGFVALGWSVRRLACDPPTATGVLVVALALRAILLPLPPTLSDDLLRYVWDGRVATAGHNPYLLAPEDEELASLRDERWRRMPHKEVPTVYPPVALGLFSIAALLPAPLLAIKVLLTLADLVTCLLLLRLAERWRLAPRRTLWYAWNPLVTLEVAGMGHVDALGATLVAAALLALTPRAPDPDRPVLPARRALAASAALAGGVLTKLAPLAALPFWALSSRRPWLVLAATGVLLAAVGLPVLGAIGGLPPGLVTYGVQWEFNGPLYEPLWRTLDALDADGIAKRLIDVYKTATEQWTQWNWIFPYLYPQFLAKLLLAAGALGVIVRSMRDARRGVSLLAGTGRLFGALLLLSATFYPWYLLWVLPWAALDRHPAWLTLSGTILLSYIPQHLGVELFPWIFLLIWLPFGCALILGRGWSTKPRETASRETP